MVGGQFASGQLLPGSPLLPMISQAHTDLHGGVPDVHGAPYGSDLRLFNSIAGVPTLHYGPGDVRYAHAPDEHVAIPQVVAAAQTLTLLILRFCG